MRVHIPGTELYYYLCTAHACLFFSYSSAFVSCSLLLSEKNKIIQTVNYSYWHYTTYWTDAFQSYSHIWSFEPDKLETLFAKFLYRRHSFSVFHFYRDLSLYCALQLVLTLSLCCIVCYCRHLSFRFCTVRRCYNSPRSLPFVFCFSLSSSFIVLRITSVANYLCLTPVTNYVNVCRQTAKRYRPCLNHSTIDEVERIGRKVWPHFTWPRERYETETRISWRWVP